MGWFELKIIAGEDAWRYKEQGMQVFHIRYRNSQGTLMRILNAVSRRGLDLASVHAEYDGQQHAVSMLVEATQKQQGQLFREWNAIVDVAGVYSGPALRKLAEDAWTPHAPASSLAEQPVRAALA